MDRQSKKRATDSPTTRNINACTYSIALTWASFPLPPKKEPGHYDLFSLLLNSLGLKYAGRKEDESAIYKCRFSSSTLKANHSFGTISRLAVRVRRILAKNLQKGKQDDDILLGAR